MIDSGEATVSRRLQRMAPPLLLRRLDATASLCYRS